MIRPMLGTNVDLTKLKYPIYASTKLDGVRAIVCNNAVYSRSGKPIANKHVQELFSKYHGLDGELIVGNPSDKKVFQNTVSGVSTIENCPDVYFYAFDYWDSDGDLDTRYDKLIQTVGLNNPKVIIVEQLLLPNEESLNTFEETCLADGFEGVILRYPEAKYKNGRSTIKEGALLKLKRFKDSEAEIIDYRYLLRNNNEAITNELGYTERSTKKENLVEDTTQLGMIIVRDIHTDIVFGIGSGFTETQRKELIQTTDLIGKIVKYKYFNIGVKDKPRFPTFLGFRDRSDL